MLNNNENIVSNCPVGSIVIAGAGGFGLEILDYLEARVSQGSPPISGFIDDTPGSPLPQGVELPHLGKIDDFIPSSEQAVVVAIGSVSGRRLVLERLWRRGIHTPAFIAKNAMVSASAVIGMGVVVCPFSIINRNAVLGAGVAVNVHCSVGHGASVGAHSILSPYVALNGNASVGTECFLGTRATIYPNIRIGDGCIVDSHAGVRSDALDRQMISSRGNYRVSALRTR